MAPKIVRVDLAHVWDKCMKAAAKIEPEMKRKFGDWYEDWNGQNVRVGVPAEMAAGIFLNEDPDLRVLPGTDGGRDLREHNVDTKGTTCDRPNLLITPKDRKKVAADRRYLLVRVSFEKKCAWLIGWAWGHEILATRPGSWPKDGTTVITPSLLHDVRDLLPKQKGLFA